ncbi:hypothetical protein BC628DRAFT_1178143 [Trametes gibbosa]|nr:hypothetical protein BC628DRAFT_1178143 [Trametes gibbosa]
MGMSAAGWAPLRSYSPPKGLSRPHILMQFGALRGHPGLCPVCAPLPAPRSPSSHSAINMLSSFMDRVGVYQFKQPSVVWGYLPQLNEWGKTALEWEVERVDGADHIPVFKAIPVCERVLSCVHKGSESLCADEGERLVVFSAMGGSKKAAKENAAALMACSGHC